MKNSFFFLPLTIGAALALSACGGGGSSSDSAPTNTSQQSTRSSITAENAAQAASNAYGAAASISASSSIVGAVLTGVSIDGPGVSTVAPALGIIKRAYSKGSMKLLTGVSMSETCSGGGTLSINGNVHSETGASNGDIITFAANNCVEYGETINGSFTIGLSGINGAAFTGIAWNATIDAQFNEFSVTTGDETVAASGDMKIAVTQISATSNSVVISGTKFQMSLTAADVNVAERTLLDYSVAETSQGACSSSVNYTMTGSSKALGQFAYSVTTLQPFSSVNCGQFTSGAMIVNGASSSVTMTILDASSIRLDYSAHADGVVTKTHTLGWASFKCSL